MAEHSVQPGAQPTNRTIFTADNLPVLRGIDSETIHLIYLDPPFNTGKQWHAPIGSDAEGASFNDIWAWDDVAEAEGETLATSVKRQWVNALHIESPIRAVVETAEATGGEEMGAYLAFMAMRLVEMQRILKPTGSIYLHCDWNASHYLRTLMDAIFGRSGFRNEIAWCYSGPGNVKRWFPRKHDNILFYAKSPSSTFNRDMVRVPFKGGGPHVGGGAFGGGMDEEDVKNYGTKGKVAEDWWTKFSPVGRLVNENVGYPTQKPLSLLERIIKASSNRGDMVLDPFCGCATACVAAENLGRQWIGIDTSKRAVELVLKRLGAGESTAIRRSDIVARTGPPDRTDMPALVNEMPIDLSLSKEVVKQRLYNQQAGICNGCERHFPPEFADLMDLDHIKARSKGGPHTWNNVQLLCRTCNVRKGSGTMAQLRKRLQQDVA